MTLYWIDHHGDLTRWWGMKQLGLMFQLISTPSLPTQPMKGCTTPLGSMPPYSLWTAVWGLLRLTRIKTEKVLWDRAYGFSSLSEKTRKSNHLQMSQQRQHILLRCFKTLSVGLAVVWTCDLPLSRPALKVTGRRLTSTMATFFCPQWRLLWRGSTVFKTCPVTG